MLWYNYLMDNDGIIENVRRLRRKGLTYKEINRDLKIEKPKSTLSYWCKGVELPKGYGRKIRLMANDNLIKAREAALVSKKIRDIKLDRAIGDKYSETCHLFNDINVAKLALSLLYLAEGSKTRRSSIMFGNSDFRIISLFLHLLRRCYKIDESKLRCTIQCRADQDINELERFWGEVTDVPKMQFYAARVDKRTVNKPSKKKGYKGVCRIDYFSAEIERELKIIASILTNF